MVNGYCFLRLTIMIPAQTRISADRPARLMASEASFEQFNPKKLPGRPESESQLTRQELPYTIVK